MKSVVVATGSQGRVAEATTASSPVGILDIVVSPPVVKSVGNVIHLDAGLDLKLP